MDKSEIMSLAEDILSESKTAVLATVSAEGLPAMRWMSPVFIRNFKNHIYAVTSGAFSKTSDIRSHNNVQWMLQDKSLNRIITLSGLIQIIEDQSLKTEVLEQIGQQLRTFWTINKDPSGLIVLETQITSAMFFDPVKGIKSLVSFNEEA